MKGVKLFYNTSRSVVGSFFFVQGLIFATWASRIPDIKVALDLSDATLGGVLLGIPVGQIAAMALSGWSVGRFGSKRMLILATILCSLSLIPIGLAPTTWAVTIALFIFGATTNLMNISVNTQGVDVERIFNKNIMPSFHGLWSLGGFMGAVLSMIFAIYELSVLAHFLTISIVCIFSTMPLYRGLIVRDTKQKSESTESRSNPLRQIDRYIILLGIIAFGAMVCEGAMFDWSGVYFKDVVSVPDSLVKLGYVVCMSTMTLGRFLAGGVISRYGNRIVVLGSGLLIASGLGLAVLSPTIISATIGLLIVGFGISSTVPICYSLAGKSNRMPASTALVVVSSISYFGFLVGPPVIGFLAEAMTLRGAFAAVALVGVAISVMSRKL